MKVGILYNVVEAVERGLDSDKQSDNEVLDIQQLVRAALQEDHDVIPLKVRRTIFTQLDKESFDIIFNLCEGYMGKVQGESWMAGFLELLGIPYTGSDPFTLSLCLDKARTKDILQANGIPTPRYQVFLQANEPIDPAVKFPLMVKPLHEDGSVGIDQGSVVEAEDKLRARVDYIVKTYRQPALVEEFIDGRELNVAIMGNPPGLEILPISEIVFDVKNGNHRIVDFDAKWVVTSESYRSTTGVCPAQIDKQLEERIKGIAVKAFLLTGCRDYARVDMRLRDDGPYVLEVNPNPGIGPDSGFARSARVSGLDYNQMIRRILHHATTRTKLPTRDRPKKKRFETDKLKARDIRLEDMPILLQWFNDTVISKFMDDPGSIQTEESLIEKFFVKIPNDIDLLIEGKGTGKPLGYCSIYDIDRVNDSAQISFLIGDGEQRGKGYGNEIVKLIVRICFESLGLNRVVASATTENVRSIKALEAAGFRRVGLLREYQVVDGRKYDEVFLEMLREEYLRLNPPPTQTAQTAQPTPQTQTTQTTQPTQTAQPPDIAGHA